MGREVKRVPMDFTWPLRKTRDGFVNPHYRECPYCNTGYTKARWTLRHHTNAIMWERDVDEEYAALTKGLAGRSPSMEIVGHDSIDAWHAEDKVIKAEGLDSEVWGICQHCEGGGIDPSVIEAYEAWERTSPPVGDGYQIWETVSEGSPISPVFATPEELADWMFINGTNLDSGISKEQWLKFITVGWAPSLVGDKNGVRSGVEAA